MYGLFRKTLSGFRLANGHLTLGRWVEGVATPFTFEASVQPTTAHDILFLDIGRREKKTYTIYTDTKLLALTPAVRNPDRVIVNGETYEVDFEAPWQNNVINHFKYIIVLMNAIEDTTVYP